MTHTKSRTTGPWYGKKLTLDAFIRHDPKANQTRRITIMYKNGETRSFPNLPEARSCVSQDFPLLVKEWWKPAFDIDTMYSQAEEKLAPIVQMPLPIVETKEKDLVEELRQAHIRVRTLEELIRLKQEMNELMASLDKV